MMPSKGAGKKGRGPKGTPTKAACCDRCRTEAATYVRYSGAHLCKRHLCEYVARRAQANIRKQMDVDKAARKPAVIVVAASGGKDSGTALDIVARTFQGRRDVEVVALTIDEGIGDYRKGCVKAVADLCKRLGIRHEVRSFRDAFSITTDAIAKRLEKDARRKGRSKANADRISKKSPCTYCGVLRRSLINRTARELGAMALVIGLNLDDTVQTVLMNITRGDLVRLARMAPHTRVQEGLVPRVLPLISVPEKENWLYARFMDIPVHKGSCPHRGLAMRNRYRRTVLDLERDSPGTRHAVLNSFFEMKEMVLDRHPPAGLTPCERCGEPTVGKVCEGCLLLEELRGRGR